MRFRIELHVCAILFAVFVAPAVALSDAEYEQNFKNCSLNLAAENCDRSLLTPGDYSEAAQIYRSRLEQGLVKNQNEKPSSARRGAKPKKTMSDAEFISLYSGSNSAYQNKSTNQEIRKFNRSEIPSNYKGDFIAVGEPSPPESSSSVTTNQQYRPSSSSAAFSNPAPRSTQSAVVPQRIAKTNESVVNAGQDKNELAFLAMIWLGLIAGFILVLYVIAKVLKKIGSLISGTKGANPQIVLPGREEYMSDTISSGRAPLLLSRFFYICFAATAISMFVDSYGYFIFLRYVYFATLLYCAQINYVFGRGGLSIICVVVALLFNPIRPVFLYSRGLWLIIDSLTLVGIYLLVDTVKTTYESQFARREVE